jgi:hypothetical protein
MTTIDPLVRPYDNHATVQPTIPAPRHEDAQHAAPERHLRKREIATSLAFGSPVQRRSLVSVLSLVREQKRIGARRDAAEHSAGERAVRDPATRRANALVAEKTGKVMTPHVRQAATVVGNLNVLDKLLRLTRSQPLVGPRGESIDFEEAVREVRPGVRCGRFPAWPGWLCLESAARRGEAAEASVRHPRAPTPTPQ